MNSSYLLQSTIPVVDLNDFYGTGKEKFVRDLGHAMRSVGFVAVVNSSIDKEQRNRVYELSQKFFSQEQPAKLQLQKQEYSGERGYVNIESPKESSVHGFDTKEFFHIGQELSAESLKNLGYPENVWPDDHEFKSTMTALYQNMIRLIPPIAEAVSLALGASASFLNEKMTNGDHLMRLIHYPKTLTGQWAAEHTDLNLLTFLPPATNEGLQVKLQNGDWVPVNVPDNAVIVNCGDMLQNLTNGEFRSAVHRVENVTGNERYSIVLFSHTQNDTPLDPLPACIERTGSVQHYPNATRKELLEYYLVALGRASHEMKSRVAGSGILDRIGKLENSHALKIRQKVLQQLNLIDEAIN